MLQTINNLEKPKVIDIGTGSGVIALTIKHECPSADVLAVDIDASALEIAQYNAKKLKLEVTFCVSDLLTNIPEKVARADLLVANLPYLPTMDIFTITPEVKAEPARALFAGEDGLSVYNRFLQQAEKLLNPNAIVMLELDPRNIHKASHQAINWQIKHIECDLVGRRRFLILKYPLKRTSS